MTTRNENIPLTRNASGQEIRTAFEARGLSSADNGTPAENLSQGKSLALELTAEDADPSAGPSKTSIAA